MTVKLTPLPKDHEEFGYPLKFSSPTPVDMPMIADSGCQSSIIPLRSALAMGIDRRDIFPVKLSMRGAIDEDLGVEGGIFVEVATADTSGTSKTTKQLVYVSRKIDKAFLCREALGALGAIPANFPAVTLQDVVATCEDEIKRCPCPERTSSPPPMPKTLPEGIDATEDNIPALKQ